MARLNLTTKGFFVLLSMMGMAVIIYLRLWNVQADIDITDTRVDRIIFEQAQNEALDEAAEWRRKYDEEAEKSNEQEEKLVEVTQLMKEKNKQVENLETRITALQKENYKLLGEVGRLKQDLEDQKLKFEKAGTKAV